MLLFFLFTVKKKKTQPFSAWSQYVRQNPFNKQTIDNQKGVE